MTTLTNQQVQDTINLELKKHSEFGNDFNLRISHSFDKGFVIVGGIIPYYGVATKSTEYVYEIFKKIDLSGNVTNVMDGRPILSLTDSLQEYVSWVKGEMRKANESYYPEFGKNLYPSKYLV